MTDSIHVHSYPLRSTKRIRKPSTVVNVGPEEVKKKIVRAGKGISLGEITPIAKNIKAAFKAGREYDLSVLHNLMYGFSGSGKIRLRNILNFSGFPEGTTRESKLKQLNSNSLYSYARYHYLRQFLNWFGKSTDGGREEIFNRILNFMFAPKL